MFRTDYVILAAANRAAMREIDEKTTGSENVVANNAIITLLVHQIKGMQSISGFRGERFLQSSGIFDDWLVERIMVRVRE